MLARHVELFAMVDAVVGELGAHALPASEVRGVLLVDQRLGLGGEREERSQGGEVGIDETVVQVVVGFVVGFVVDECEEAHFVTDLPEPLGKRNPVGAGCSPLA